ncbi:mannose-6-phosphate isomerase [Croceicoccus estronivorus]|uniref:class I mannose-6-phosphate isomerase n=1 Tax=Croceicoccus estronivorus TaxID=1172626 RepID=UPI000829DCE2|nr:class I mannose-6-phosphate isomerase [Croceicoccus estronivorus]OCC22984.1 mannose-6-phosphate isomerase [Croceicoccus estronivorus]
MKLATRMVEKPWGRDVLPAPFDCETAGRIGEIWFEPPPMLDELLVKYLFTSEKLSVQVHPAAGKLSEAPCGKEECWLVMDAEPGAMLGIGFTAPVSPETMRRAALDGSIENMLAWHPVRAGDFFYIPAGTVHAIGGGVSLIEVQLNCDVTYRLYDYGRPRELHLDKGIGVACGEAYDPALHRAVPPFGSVSLVDGPYFRLDRVAGAPDADCTNRYADGPLLVIPLAGMVTAADLPVAPGECAALDTVAHLECDQDALCLLAQPCKSGDMIAA